MPSRGGSVAFEREPSFGLQQVKKLADAEIVLQRGFLGWLDRAGVVFQQQLADATRRTVIEVERDQLFRQLRAECGAIRLDNLGEDVGFGEGGFSRHTATLLRFPQAVDDFVGKKEPAPTPPVSVRLRVVACRSEATSCCSCSAPSRVVPQASVLASHRIWDVHHSP